MPSVEFVVAKYTENVEWTEKIVHKVTIYNKSKVPNPKFITLPNLGHEANTFLHHIVTNYNTLADTVIFLQGNPFDHITIDNPSIEHVIHNMNNVKCDPGTFHPAWTTMRADNGETYVEWVERAKKIPFPNNPLDIYFKYAYGAQYIVSKTLITLRPLKFWEKAYEMSKTSIYGDTSPDKIDPWSFELLWPLLYDSINYPISDWP